MDENNLAILAPEDAVISHFSSFVPIFSAQWLKQIDSTEAALSQKMIDLENDKVKKFFYGESSSNALTLLSGR